MKSRTILKYQYDELGSFLCEEYIKKHKLQNKKQEFQSKVTDIMADELPDIVKQAYKEYPKYFVLKGIDISDVTSFISPTERCYDPSSYSYSSNLRYLRNNYSEDSIKYANELYDELKKLGLEQYYSRSYWGYNPRNGGNIFNVSFKGLEISNYSDDLRYNTNKQVNAICSYIVKHPKIGELLKEYIIEIAKYSKFKKDISCAFSTITTTNMLKNEIPEAYDFFYNKWGEEYEKQDAEEKDRKNKEKKAQCDKIEGLRAAIS